MSKRAAIYVRVSTKDQKDHGYSLPTQIEACAAYAAERGYKVVCDPFQDDFTGMRMDRPALDKLREAVTTFNIEVVIVLDLDRLARKVVYQMLLEEEFTKLGAAIEYANGRYEDSDEGRFQKNIRAVVAEYERAKILERMKRGKIGKAKSGKVLIGAVAPYGYLKVGTGDEAVLEANEAEAAVVQGIFSWYVRDGLSVYAIVDRLTEEGVLPRGGSRSKFERWSTSSIAKILGNELYTGVWYYNRTSDTKQGGRRVVRQRPREEWIGVPVPRLIDDEIFAAARARAALNQAQASRNRKHLYLFSGFLTCGTCGRNMSGRTPVRADGTLGTRSYACTHTASRFKDDRCTMPAITEAELDAAAWQWIIELVNNPDIALRALNERQAIQEEEYAPRRARLAEITAKIADHQRQLQRLLDTFERNPDLPAEWFDERKGRLVKLKADFDRERVALAAQLEEQYYTPERLINIKAFLSELRGRMELATVESKLLTLDMLDFRSCVKIENHHKVAYVTCVLGKDQKLLDDCRLVIQCT